MSDENWTGSIGTDSHLRLGQGSNAVILESFGSQLAIRVPGSSTRTIVAGGGGSPGATLLVAASNATAKTIASADYTCDGVADEVEINAALAAVAATGGAVRLSEGTFGLQTSILMLAQNVELWGSGWGTIIQPQSALFNPTWLVQVGTSGTGNLANNAIRSMRFVYDPAVYATGSVISASSNVMRIDDIFIQGSPLDGVSLSSFVVTEFAEQRITNCRIYNVGRDAVVTDSNILDLNCVNVRTSGLFATRGRYGFNISASYFNMTACRANDFYNGWGVNLVGGYLAQIVGCHLDENGAGAQAFGTGKNGQGGGGITSDSSSRVLCVGNKFNSNDSYDVYASSSNNSRWANNTSDGNTAKGPKQASIYIAGGNNIAVEGNVAVDMVSRAIVLASATRVLVRGNISNNPNQAATNPSLRLFAATFCHVTGNQFSNGIIEESTSDSNLIESNPLTGGTIVAIGANTVVRPWRIPAYPSIASATALPLTRYSTAFNITGTTTITSIPALDAGTVVNLRFAGILTVTDGSNLKLNGNLTTAADTSLSLLCDGTNWIELARSVN